MTIDKTGRNPGGEKAVSPQRRMGDSPHEPRHAQEHPKFRLPEDVLETLKEIYATLSYHTDLSVVAFGVVSDHLVKYYGLSRDEALALISEFPEMLNSAKRLQNEQAG